MSGTAAKPEGITNPPIDDLLVATDNSKYSLVIYAADFPGKAQLLKSLGKHKGSKGCLYINKLADVDIAVLRRILERGLEQIRKTWPVTAS